MLPLSHRLPSEHVRSLLRAGKRISGDWYQFVFQKSSGVPRFGFLVSVKVDKRAVVRNRIRRLLRESVHHCLPNLVALDGVFIVRKNIAEKTHVEVEQNLREMFQRAGLLK